MHLIVGPVWGANLRRAAGGGRPLRQKLRAEPLCSATEGQEEGPGAQREGVRRFAAEASPFPELLRRKIEHRRRLRRLRAVVKGVCGFVAMWGTRNGMTSPLFRQ